jgi:hypothetical protein
MNDQDKVKVQSMHPVMPESRVLDNLVEHTDNSSDEIYVKKGFPLELKVFWGIIGALFLIKMISFVCFDLPSHRMVKKQRLAIQILEQNQQYTDALKIHEALMEQYPFCYKEFYYLDIARCYFSCTEIEYHMIKGLELLKNKQLSEREFRDLKYSLPTPFKDLFEMQFSVYEKEKDKSRIYILDSANLELE